MNGWIIAADGSAVNLRHVTHALAEKRSHADDSWYVLGRPAGIALVTGLDSREAATTWIERHFRETADGSRTEWAPSLPNARPLASMIGDAIYGCGSEFSLGVDDERVPVAEGVGLIIGVVQGWLAGEREKDTVNRDVYGTIDELIREAGRGLGVEDATSS